MNERSTSLEGLSIMGQTLAKIALGFPLHCSFVVLQRRHGQRRVSLRYRLLIANAPAAVLLFNVVVCMGLDLGVLMAYRSGSGHRVRGLLLPGLGGTALLCSARAGLRTAPGNFIPPGLPESLELVFCLVHD
jgi:hypothetical protein